MKSQDYNKTITVDQSPDDAIAAITNMRGWWSENIEGSTDTLGGEFTYRYQNVHSCTMKMTELIPGKKVVWRVLENYFNFTQDKSEWVDTELIFEVSRKGNKTEIRFTHKGLVPDYECFEICSDAWGSYINGSLRSLITSGKGKPNQKETGIPETVVNDQSYTTAFTVDQSPEEAFAAINDVRAWWTGKPGVIGNTDKLGDVFTYEYAPHHHTTQKVTELIPGKRVVWNVIDSSINFVEDKNEWTGTNITFDIAKKGKRTEVRFTHHGLAPSIECFDGCSNAWSSYINGSLFSLISAANR